MFGGIFFRDPPGFAPHRHGGGGEGGWLDRRSGNGWSQKGPWVPLRVLFSHGWKVDPAAVSRIHFRT